METEYKLKRKLGFWAAIAGSVGLVVSGTAMVSVGAVAGATGSGAWLPTVLSIIPMLAVACAYGELSSMLPGGGMIGDYTMPALGKFWSVMSILMGYILLVACDGGTQQIVGALALEEVTGISYVWFTLMFFIIVMAVCMFGIQVYARFEVSVTIALMALFFLISLLGTLGVGEAAGMATVVNPWTPMAPEVSWGTCASYAGTAVWFYIGFEFVCPMAEENRAPHKNIPKAMIIGIFLVFITDMLFMIASTKYADLGELASSSTPHIVGAKAFLGNVGYAATVFITVTAAITSAVGHMTALPRMLYGLAHKNLAPKAFTYVHPKWRTPWIGIFFTTALWFITVVYMFFKGTGADIIIMLVNIACTTWLISYAMACIDVIIYRKRYPDFPRLWKAPGGVVTMVIGLIGIAYCIWTMRYIWIPAAIATMIFAIYTAVWLKTHKIKLGEREPIQGMIREIQRRSEPLPEWDEAVNKWIDEGKIA